MSELNRPDLLQLDFQVHSHGKTHMLYSIANTIR